MKRLAGEVTRALFGPEHTWGYRQRAEREAADLPMRLEDALRWSTTAVCCSTDRPIFILSAGWRSGSTLLQRMIMQHNSKLLIWGEPFNMGHILDGMISQFKGFNAAWPKKSHFLSKRGNGVLAQQWVANLYPDVDDLFQANLAFLDRLFAQPARAAGYAQWGVKEVRWTIEHAIFLRRLYPNCKIIFLCRDPFDSYASYYRICDGWFFHWPDQPIATPYAFGRCWARLAQGYLKGHKMVDGLLVRYEDLSKPATVERLNDYLGWPVSAASSLERVTGDTADRSRGNVVDLPYIDRFLLDMAVGRTRAAVGYPAIE